MKHLLFFAITLTMLFSNSMSYSQGPNSCACVWSDSEGNLNCSFGNCGGGNWNNCYNQVSTPNLWQTNTCPEPTNTNCNPYMWNTGTNGSCWYQGSGCSGEAVCEYIYTPLPVELIGFYGWTDNQKNEIRWITASEINCASFQLITFTKDSDGTTLILLPGNGNTTQRIEYNVTHWNPEKGINYYYLIQSDFDGKTKTYGPISIDNREKVNVVRILNTMGQEVDSNAKGFLIFIYDDGTTKQIYKK